MATSLIAHEWQQGTLTQLALRRPLFLLLCLRMGYLMLYLIICVGLATLLSLGITAHRSDLQNDSWRYLGEIYLTTLPPTLLLLEIGLLFTNALVSNLAGYTLGLLLWLGNLVASLYISGQSQIKTNIFMFSLFSWHDRTVLLVPQNWWKAKFCLLGLALILHLFQIFLLHHQARMIRNIEE